MSQRRSDAKVEEWRGRLARYAQSKLTIGQFCLKERVSEPSFFMWRKRLRSMTPDGAKPSAERRGFRPVQVVPAVAPVMARATRIRFGSNVEIELGSDLAVVELVLEQLLQRAASDRPEVVESC